MRQRGGRRQVGYSRWSLLEAIRPAADPVEPRARQLLRRYGVLFPEVLAREPLSPPWRDLVRVLRRLEARGEIRGGRFVSGFMGEQFALPEAVGILRSVKCQAPTGNRVVISACDPLNLAGILTPGERAGSFNYVCGMNNPFVLSLSKHAQINRPLMVRRVRLRPDGIGMESELTTSGLDQPG